MKMRPLLYMVGKPEKGRTARLTGANARNVDIAIDYGPRMSSAPS